MYCPICGAYVEDGQAFCDSCGAQLGAEEAQVFDAPQFAEEPASPDATSVQAPVDEEAVIAEEPASQAQEEPLVDVEPERRAPAVSAPTVLAPISPLESRGRHASRQQEANLAMMSGIALGVAAVLITAMLVFAHPFSGRLGSEPAPVPDPVEAEVDATEADATASKEGEPEEDQGLTLDDIPVRDSLIAYSWEELSVIAAGMEQCSTRDAALGLAREYNLVDATGALPAESKELDLSDGRPMYFRLVDVWHDVADTPSGRAGMTFVATNALFEGVMSDSYVTEGGWESSPMREWLNYTFWYMLPQEVQNAIIPVQKMSNNVGETLSITSVTATKDWIWLPSIVELVGPVNWDYYSDPSNTDLYNAVFNAEGSWYAAFQQMGITDGGGNQILAFSPSGWWLRSTAASTGRGRYVDEYGDPTSYGDSDVERGVVPAFCL